MKTTAVRQDKDKVTPQDLQKMWKNVDLSRFWADVVKNVSKETDAYEHARAKSREGAAHQVLL